MNLNIVVTWLDALQALGCGAILVSTICRLNLLQWGVHRLEPIVAQLLLLAGAIVLAVGWLFDAHATWASVLFVASVAGCSAVGASRWRGRAPADAHREAYRGRAEADGMGQMAGGGQ